MALPLLRFFSLLCCCRQYEAAFKILESCEADMKLTPAEAWVLYQVRLLKRLSSL
jgi:hypothetical protein